MLRKGAASSGGSACFRSHWERFGRVLSHGPLFGQVHRAEPSQEVYHGTAVELCGFAAGNSPRPSPSANSLETCMAEDYYSTLGVRRGASPQEIQKAYRDLAQNTTRI